MIYQAHRRSGCPCQEHLRARRHFALGVLFAIFGGVPIAVVGAWAWTVFVLSR